MTIVFGYDRMVLVFPWTKYSTTAHCDHFNLLMAHVLKLIRSVQGGTEGVNKCHNHSKITTA